MQRVTIKDIAQITKMSPGTVHRALYGKKGVSDEVRQNILKVAKELGYTPNYVASSLKRKTLNIVVLLPSIKGRGKYFYLSIWEGIEKAFSEYKDYNLKFIPLTYDNQVDSQDYKDEVLNKFMLENDIEINGLITQPNRGFDKELTIRKCIDNEIPTSFIIDDMEDANRVCYVGADYFSTGMLCAELLSTQIDDGKDIMIFCANKDTPSHKQIVSGFEYFIKTNKLNYNLIKIFDSKDKQETIELAKRQVLNNKNLKAIYSVNARNTVLLCETLKGIKYKKTFRVVGSDVFKESIEYMEQGILDNIVHKNPVQQSYQATKILIDYIVKNETPKHKVVLSNTEIVFKSNLKAYKTT